MNRIRDALGSIERKKLVAEDVVSSAVLVPVFEMQGQLTVLMEQRPDNLSRHSGQISFPGGIAEPEDKDVIATALRESFEEVGISPADVQVLGVLDDLVTVTGYLITPVVGWIPYPYKFRLDHREVAQLLHVPLQSFVARYRQQGPIEMAGGTIQKAIFYPFEEHRIWGATARIASQLADILEGCDCFHLEG